jgi:phage repressor protein C with HTH and peptisase S24 domain
MKSVGSRLKAARVAAGYKTAKEFADKHGLPQPTYANHENDKRGLRRQTARYYADALDVTVEWLLDGKESAGDEHSEKPRAKAAKDGQQEVIEYDSRLSAGGGRNHDHEHVRASWSMPTEYLRYELGINSANFGILETVGDSMDPTILSGDRVMVNFDDRTPSPPGIFALWDGLGTVIKRVEHIPNSEPITFRIISDNNRYDSYERTADEVNVIGRVIWRATRL